MLRSTKAVILAVAAVSPTSTRAFSQATRGTFLVNSALKGLAITQGTKSLVLSTSDLNQNQCHQKTTALSMTTSSSSPAELLCVHVFVSVVPGTEEAFLDASLANARNSALEAGIARFDVIQQIDDPTKFVLVEVYKNDEAPALHKETDHYKKWRETVADMMAEPRKALKYKNHFPATTAGWDYSPDSTLE